MHPFVPSSLKSFRTLALLVGLTAATVAAVSVADVRAQQPDLIAKLDQSQLLRLPRPAAEIIIGNPAVADVTIQSGNLLVVTGKSFGITNMIILDAERQVIQDQRVMVRRDENSVVHVYKAASRQSFNCAPQCNPAIVPGDDEAFMSRNRAQAESKIGFNERAAADNGGGGGGAGNQ